MTKYLVHYNSVQENELQELRKDHEGDNSVNNFEALIQKLCDSIDSDPKKFNAQVWGDSLLGSLRRINMAKKKFVDVPFDFETTHHDERTSWCLVFFQNAKVFIETIKSNFHGFELKSHKRLIEDITEIRNYFAHDYNKNFSGNVCIIRIDQNHHENGGLIKLEIMDMESSERVGDVYLSLSLFFSEIKNMLEALIKFIQKKSTVSN